jgi:hypothetical protein
MRDRQQSGKVTMREDGEGEGESEGEGREEGKVQSDEHDDELNGERIESEQTKRRRIL